ncbi:MAG: BatA and WFA domain-containing protein [Lentisphaeria bacterium]|nr:BatA and WFA domain-containing protein [Lentisphaeria bacterium]
MDFGSAAFLWGLLAVPAPILIHLFFKRKKSYQVFSTLQFFEKKERYLAHRRKIRDLLLLLLRCLILFCLVLALAKPLLRSVTFQFGSRSDVVLIIDDTLSMGHQLPSGERAYDLAINKAREIIDLLEPEDTLSLVWVSGREGVKPGRDLSRIEDQLQTNGLTDTGKPYAGSLQQAADLLAGTNAPNKEIFFIGDFQKGYLPEKSVAQLEPDDTRIFFIPIRGMEENVAVTDVHTGRRPKITGQTFFVHYQVTNRTPHKLKLPVELYIHGKKVQEKMLTLLPQGKLKDSFQLNLAQAGQVQGKVKISYEDLQADNERHFTFHIREYLNCLLLESDLTVASDPYFFIEKAINPTPDNIINGIKTEREFLEEISPALLQNQQLVIIDSPKKVTLQSAKILEGFMQQGGMVLFSSNTKTNSTTLTNFQTAAVKELIGNKRNFQAKGLEFLGSLSPLNELVDMQFLTWQRLQELHPVEGIQALASINGDPVIQQVSVGKGQFIALGFSLRRSYNNWPTLKSFPVSFVFLLHELASDLQLNNSRICGDMIQVATSQDAQVRYQDQQFQISVLDDFIQYSDTWYQGIIEIETDRVHSYSLNPPSEESNLEQAGDDLLVDKLSSGEGLIIFGNKSLEEQVLQKRNGTDLSKIFLLFALFLFILEQIIGNRYRFEGFSTLGGVKA